MTYSNKQFKRIFFMVSLLATVTGSMNATTLVVLNNTNYEVQLSTLQQMGNSTPLADDTTHQQVTIAPASFENFTVDKSDLKAPIIAQQTAYNAQFKPSTPITFNGDAQTIFVGITQNKENELVLRKLNTSNQATIVVNNTTETPMLLKLEIPLINAYTGTVWGSWGQHKGMLFYAIPAQNIITIARPDLNVELDNKQKPQKITGLQSLTATIGMSKKVADDNELPVPINYQSYNGPAFNAQLSSDDAQVIDRTSITFPIGTDQKSKTSVITIHYQHNSFGMNKNEFVLEDHL